jgi:hypothetical protein
MSWLLVIQPDAVQADILRKALYAEISEQVVVAGELDYALSLIDQHLPDVILLPALISTSVEERLIAYVGAIPGSGHVQILGLPQLERGEEPVERRTRSLLPWRRQGRPAALTSDCDPAVFTRDVVAYLAGARTLKELFALHRAHVAAGARPERRCEPRFAINEVPWISIVRFGTERAALINVSSRGALLRLRTRPDPALLRRRFDPALPTRQPHVTLELESDGEIRAIGRVIRCVPVRARVETQYEVAFSFDESVGLHLPAAGALLHAASAASEMKK